MNYPLVTERLSRRYARVEAVRDLNLSVPEGSLFALLGPNGAGKTTTIHVLMNLLRPSSGRATLLGVESTHLGASELARIGYVSENQKLPGWMTVEQLLAFCKPLYPAWDDSLCGKLVRKFDLPLKRKVRALSRGMKLKAAMVAALAYRPRLLVLDEPFGGLDVAVREELVEGMLELAGQAEWTLFISSHDLEDIENLVDWVGFIDEGSLLFSEELDQLRARFREIEITMPQTATIPADPPKTWLVPQLAGNVIRFMESQYRQGECETRIKEVFPAVESLSVSPLSLRSIFVTLARQGKGNFTQGAGRDAG